MGLLWVGKGAKALVGVEPGGIGRYRVECGVRRTRRVDCSVLEQSNLTKPLFDVVFIWTFANSVGVCGVGAVLGTAVRSAWRVWLLNHWRGVPSGSACWSWRAVGGGCDRPECLKKRIFCREFTELPGLRIPKLEGGSAEPHGGYAHRISVRRGHWLGRETSNEI